MNFNEGIAEAMEGWIRMVAESGSISDRKVQIDTCNTDIRYLREKSMNSFGNLFGASTNKVFCTCGAIADLDSSAVSLKRRLGKEVECRHCRNIRIAEEQRELKELYSEEEEGWLYS